MNRVIRLVLSILLVTLLLATPVFATTGSGSAAASSANVAAGDTVTVVFSVSGFEAVNTLSVSYAVPEGLKLEKAEWLVAGTISDVNVSKGQAVWTKEESVDMSAKTDIFKLTFTVKEMTGESDVTHTVKIQATAKNNSEVLGKVSASASVVQKAGCKHELQEVAAKAATCKAEGNNLYYTCKKCDLVFAADKTTETTVAAQTLAKVAHAGGKATCTEKAKCATCGEAYGELAAHSYSESWSGDGEKHWHVCSVCGDKKDAAAHNGGEATCDAQAKCEICGEGYGETIDHNYKWIVDKYPSEGAAGSKHEECEACGHKKDAVAIDKLTHSPKKVEGKAASCTEDGILEHFYCGNCGRYYASANGKVGDKISKDEIVAKATGHSFDGEWENDANGHWHVCACGEKEAAVAHEFELVGEKEATETETGYTGDEVCKVCAYEGKKGEEIPCLETEPATEPSTEPATEPSVPAETQDQQGEPEEKKNNAVLWIIPVVIAAAGAVVAPVIIKRKRG